MNHSAQFLNPTEAARQLGVSTKALRLYEQRGLLVPARTAAGWRIYGPAEMARAGEIAALRALGLSLAQVARVLSGDPACLAPALRRTRPHSKARSAGSPLPSRRSMRFAPTLPKAGRPPAENLRGSPDRTPRGVAFALPWPWGGETFALRDIRPLNYIVGPLGSGKTRLAR